MRAWMGEIVLAVAIVEGYLIFCCYRYLTRKCPSCSSNAEKWGVDVMGRIREWDALLEVAQELTGRSRVELVSLAVDKLNQGELQQPFRPAKERYPC